PSRWSFTRAVTAQASRMARPDRSEASSGLRTRARASPERGVFRLPAHGAMSTGATGAAPSRLDEAGQALAAGLGHRLDLDLQKVVEHQAQPADAADDRLTAQRLLRARDEEDTAGGLGERNGSLGARDPGAGPPPAA